MSRSLLRGWGRRTAVAAAALVLAGTGWGSTAHASVAQGSVYGAGVITNDWGDEGPLSTTTNSYNNVVALWQNVLWADGYLPVEGLDCVFGPQTRAATIEWQRDHGLAADGIVGSQTFGKADNYLFWSGNEIHYDGSVRDLTGMHRNSAGRWYWTYSTGDFTAYFDYAPYCGSKE